MSSLLNNFQYDIFISYRHNDNLPTLDSGRQASDGWVTDFVQNLEKELRSTLKNTVTIYFDKNPHDGLLETYNVDKSLEGKLKCIIFIPIISQTYCDTKSFAWQHEFVAFNKLAKEDSIGRDIKLSNGNVASRILPIKIHDLDAEDQAIIENELGGALRAIDFIFKSPGVNRPLTSADNPDKNQNKTFYRDQVNKVANAIKEILAAMKEANPVNEKSAIKRERPRPETFFEKVQARSLPRVGLVYIIFGFLIFQLSKSVTAWLLWPVWVAITFLSILVLGFPLALFSAWRFEFSPSGLIRISPSEAINNPYSASRKKPFTGNWVLALLLTALVIQYFISLPASNTDQHANNSIAVLYFDNISSDPEQEYFSDGITEEITAHLSSIKGLRVTSRTSVLQYKGKGKALNIKEIASQLNVNNVLEGSVRKAGDKLRITVQLIDARTDQHIWTEVYDRDLADVFKIQSEIAQAIASKFRIAISPEVNEKIISVPTANIEAYELYLKARSIPRPAGDGMGTYFGGTEQAISLLKEAIKLDPDFVEPYVFLSYIYMEFQFEFVNERRDSAALLAKEAIIRNPKSADGYIALANTQDFENSLKWLRKACELDSTMGLLGMAGVYRNKAEFPKAVQCYAQVSKIDPNSFEAYSRMASIYASMAQPDSINKYVALANRVAPNNKGINGTVMFYKTYTGQIDAARESAKKYWEDDTLNYNKEIGIACMMARDWKQAETYYLRSGYHDMDWGLVLIKLGRKEEGIRVLRASLAFRGTGGWLGDLSRINIMLGNKTLGISYLKKLVEGGWHEMAFMRNDPFWDEVRNEPEFKKIAGEMERKNVEMFQQIKENGKKKFSLDF